MGSGSELAMGTVRTVLFKRTEVVLASAVTSFAALTASPTTTGNGAWINVAPTNRGQGTNETNEGGVWQAPGFGGAMADSAVFIYGSAALTFSAGLALYGWRADLSLWFQLGVLNGGVAPPVLSAVIGYSAVVETVGVYDGLALGPIGSSTVTVSGGTCTARACQIKQVEDIWG